MSVVQFPQPPSVEEVLDSVDEHAEELKAIYVVGVAKDGTGRVWASGKMVDLCFANALIQSLVFKYLNENVLETDG